MIQYFTTQADGETAIQRQSDRATQREKRRRAERGDRCNRWPLAQRCEGTEGRAYIGRPVLEKANLLTA